MRYKPTCKLTPLAALTVAVLVFSLLCEQETEGLGISVRPNTLLEFSSLQCRGEFDKKEYSVLTRLCEDCYNLFREKFVYDTCRSNCFQNTIFRECVSALLLSDQMEDYERRVALASG